MKKIAIPPLSPFPGFKPANIQQKIKDLGKISHTACSGVVFPSQCCDVLFSYIFFSSHFPVRLPEATGEYQINLVGGISFAEALYLLEGRRLQEKKMIWPGWKILQTIS